MFVYYTTINLRKGVISMHIKAFRNQVFIGYIRSVSPRRGSYCVTKDVSKAKTYKTETAVMMDIDFCSRCEPFTVFTYSA